MSARSALDRWLRRSWLEGEADGWGNHRRPRMGGRGTASPEFLFDPALAPRCRPLP
jgi:hypothetical protein